MCTVKVIYAILTTGCSIASSWFYWRHSSRLPQYALLSIWGCLLWAYNLGRIYGCRCPRIGPSLALCWHQSSIGTVLAIGSGVVLWWWYLNWVDGYIHIDALICGFIISSTLSFDFNIWRPFPTHINLPAILPCRVAARPAVKVHFGSINHLLM